MSETELSVICKNCGSEVSPYVTECPYCGARLRKRAPKLERRGDALEAKPRGAGRPAAAPPRLRCGAERGRRPPLRDPGRDPRLGRRCCSSRRRAATRSSTFGGLVVPVRRRVVAATSPRPSPTSTSATCSSSRSRLAIFATGLERRLGTRRRPRSCCSPAARWGCWPRAAIADARDDIDVIAGGNGMALGRARRLVRAPPRRGARRDRPGVRHDRRRRRRRVLLALPLFESTRRRLRRPGRRRRRRPRRLLAARRCAPPA